MKKGTLIAVVVIWLGLGIFATVVNEMGHSEAEGAAGVEHTEEGQQEDH